MPVPVSFLIRLQASGLRPATLLKKRLWHRRFPVNFAKFLRTPVGCFFLSKTLFATGVTNFKESLLRMPRSSLFHSVIEEGKNNL